jgi:hypothetical protein
MYLEESTIGDGDVRGESDEHSCAPGGPDEDGREPPHVSVVVNLQPGPLCVAVVDSPPPQPSGGICRCPACHGNLNAELASWFL